MELMLLGRNDEEGRRYALPNGETLIGRKPVYGIFLNAPSIAARHARVFSVDERAVIYGISPEWPVYVNGHPVTRRVLEDGDDVELAHYRLRFVRHPQPVQTTSSPPQSVDSPSSETMAENATSSLEEPETPEGTEQPEMPERLVIPEAPEESAVLEGSEASEGSEGLDTSETSETSEAPEAPERSEAPDALRAREKLEPLHAPEIAELPEEWVENPAEEIVEDDPMARLSPAFHLDILSGINEGRRVTLTHDRVVLGFDRQRLVEIRTAGNELTLRALKDDVDARLNGKSITESFTAALPGDLLWLRRISMRIHQD